MNCFAKNHDGIARVRPVQEHSRGRRRGGEEKMNDKAFARAVNRDDITRGAEELGMPLDK
jgi:predicted hydrolase (HD superfamily)